MDQKKQMKFQNEDVLGKHRKQVGENGVLRELKRRPFKRYRRTKMLFSGFSYEIFIEYSPLASHDMKHGCSKISRKEPWLFGELIESSCVEINKVKKRKRKEKKPKKQKFKLKAS